MHYLDTKEKNSIMLHLDCHTKLATVLIDWLQKSTMGQTYSFLLNQRTVPQRVYSNYWNNTQKTKKKTNCTIVYELNTIHVREKHALDEENIIKRMTKDRHCLRYWRCTNRININCAYIYTCFLAIKLIKCVECCTILWFLWFLSFALGSSYLIHLINRMIRTYVA
jgi:hypothetical protein